MLREYIQNSTAGRAKKGSQQIPKSGDHGFKILPIEVLPLIIVNGWIDLPRFQVRACKGGFERESALSYRI
jgi:hypothetical protein